MAIWINENGVMNLGDQQPGEREATQEEIASWQALGRAEAVRIERNRRLALIDIEINKQDDAGQSSSTLRAKRQALRDVPEQELFPACIDWPWAP